MNPAPLPPDIGPARGVNLVLGLCLLLLSAFPGGVVAMAIYHDGLSSVLDWPALFNWLSLLAAALAGCGMYLLVTPQRVGGEVIFHPDGFTLRIRLFFRPDRTYRLAWSEIASVQILEAGRQKEMTIRTRSGAKPNLSTRLLDVPWDEALARLRDSAEGAGYRLEAAGGINLLVAERQVWTVQRRD